MKKFALFLFFLLPFATAGQAVDVYLYLGQLIEVNDVPIELLDISKTGDKAAIKVGNDTYVLSFGESIIYENWTIHMGSIELSKKRVRLILEGVESIKGSSRLNIEIPYPSKVASLRDEVSFTLQITNEGDDALFPLSYALPKDFEAYFYAENSKVNEVYIKHGETKTITFVVKVSNVEGEFDIYAFVGNSSAKMHLSVESKEEYEVHAEYLGKAVEAGQEVTFPITIKAYSDTLVSLNASAPEGWKVYFKSGSEKVTKLYLFKGSNIPLTLVISIPSDTLIGTYNVSANIGSEVLVFEVYVEETHAGENGIITLRVTDSSNGAYISSALVEVLNENETLDQVYTTPDGRAQLEVPEGSYTLRVSKEGYESYEKEFEVEAGKNIDLGIISLDKIPYYYTLECNEPSKSAVLGESLQYKIIIENLGLQDDSYKLTLRDLPDNWAYRIVESLNSKVGISETFVKADSQKTIYLIIIPPNNAELKKYNFIIEVQSRGNKEVKELELEANLIGSYDMNINLERYSFEMKTGETKEISVWIYNSGSSPLTNVQLNVEVPEGWLVTIEPDGVASIEANKYAEFKVSITSPQNLEAGDYKITIKASSDQLSKEENVRITIKKSSTQTYLGIGIILISMLLLGALLKKYGRK
jgi:uncharacterized membrane protein